MLVSVVIPCYNSEQTIGKIVEMTLEVFKGLDGYEAEFVLVNDNSRDGTYEEIKRLARENRCVRGINLMRNFGQHNALMCALNYAEGDLILGMDDDLQTHPSQIPPIINKQKEGYDVVYGIYEKRLNSRKKNLSSWFNKVTSRVLIGRPKEIQSSNFWLITRAVRDEVIKYKNYNPYVDCLFYRTSHNVGNVVIEHHKREVGSSNYTFFKLVKLWMAYFNYSVIPLRIASFIGCVSSLIGFIAAIVTVIRKLLDPSILVGWSSVVCLLLIFFGIVLLVLGVIGEYIGEIVLSMSNTPQFIVRDTVNIECPGKSHPGK